MKWEEISVSVGEEAKDAVINLFYEAGASGVVIEDARSWQTYAEEGLWDAYQTPQEMLELESVLVKGYLPDDDKLAETLKVFGRRVEDLSSFFTDYNAQISLEKIENEDWENKWKDSYKTTHISDRLVICPSWESYEKKPGELVIKLDPGMAFGTGQHVTTERTARYLERYLRPGDRVIDVGTGSGILAIAAAKLGASSVRAMDNDPTAVKIAKNNVAANQVEDVVEVFLNDLLIEQHDKADLICANLVADLVVSLLDKAYQLLEEGGRLIVSGVLDKKADRVRLALKDKGFHIEDEICRKEWVTLVGKK